MTKPKTTVICAVWSQDPKRHTLLAQHQENLLKQTRATHMVYVFDQADQPPDFLQGTKIVCSSQLSIYEAWNIALSACRTEYVMNLNLDDRLNIDAVELFEESIESLGADLIGGDWKICYSQETTNAVTNCYGAEALPFVNEWPPVEGTKTRLGSSVSERGTYGPATMWRLDAHISMPRYPYRTSNGELIQGISDAIWWGLLENNFAKKLVKLPIIVGNYYSHPSEQAEFRNLNEWDLVNKSNISLI